QSGATLAACLQAIGDDHKNTNHQNKQGCQGVDLGLEAQTYARKNFHRQGGKSRTRQERGNHHIVQRQGKSQQPGSHQGRHDRGQDNLEKRSQGSGAQIQRRFFLGAIQLTHTRLQNHGGIGGTQDHMPYPDRESSVLYRPAKQAVQFHKHQQQGNAQHHFRNDQQCADQTNVQGKALEAPHAGQQISSPGTQNGGHGGRQHRNQKGQLGGTEQGLVLEQGFIPAERKTRPGRHDGRFIK